MPLLRNASFDLAAGEIGAIVGSMRDGRSALLRAIAGLKRPDSGHVKFTDATTTSLSHPRDLLGIKFSWIDTKSTPSDFVVQEYIVTTLLIGGGYKAREAEHLAREALDQMGITDYGEMYVRGA